MASRVTAIVTGAGSGIGKGLCEALARDNYDVVVTDIDPGLAQQVADELPGEVSHLALKMDVSDEASISRALKRMSPRQIHVLINNAGIQHMSPIETFNTIRWNQLIGVMLNGTFFVSRAVIPHMRAGGFGRIINIGSIHSLVASPYKSAYVAVKHAAIGLSKTLALETADADITVNTICPSYVRTPLVDRQIADQAKYHSLSESEVIEQIMLKPMPKKAFVTTEEIAGAVRYLASDIARNITGQTIVIDGGWTAH